eukprot:NODE_13950_length_1137_cov_3.811881.p1 GENE.NODE_13950_length_1137_cov_3.811881~~NODE_13950_length_1137_cov_3.811881.p1  ORF type:complete len:240 (-),score=87.45 NODE_13950_length_1137_cov_3.811881:304-1023(-)
MPPFNILVYGDSNTWGFDAADPAPAGIGRHPLEERWTTVMAKALGERYYVVVEGLGGRTTCFEDQACIGGYTLSGRTCLMPLVYSHRPLDLVVIMLGTNDLKERLSNSPVAIAQGARALIRDTLTSLGAGATAGNSVPKVLLIAPVPIYETPLSLGMDFRGCEERSRALAPLYETVAKEMGVAFLDAANFAEISPLDGVHISRETLAALGEAVAVRVRAIFECPPAAEVATPDAPAAEG